MRSNSPVRNYYSFLREAWQVSVGCLSSRRSFGSRLLSRPDLVPVSERAGNFEVGVRDFLLIERYG